MRLVLSTALESFERKEHQIPEAYYQRRHGMLEREEKKNGSGKGHGKETRKRRRERYEQHRQSKVEFYTGLINKANAKLGALEEFLSTVKNKSMTAQLRKLLDEKERLVKNIKTYTGQLERLDQTVG